MLCEFGCNHAKPADELQPFTCNVVKSFEAGMRPGFSGTISAQDTLSFATTEVIGDRWFLTFQKHHGTRLPCSKLPCSLIGLAGWLKCAM